MFRFHSRSDSSAPLLSQRPFYENEDPTLQPLTNGINTPNGPSGPKQLPRLYTTDSSVTLSSLNGRIPVDKLFKPFDLTSQRTLTVDDSEASKSSKGLKFWLILLALCLTLFLSALEFTAVSTALPTIVDELKGANFVWVGSSYALSSSAAIPLSGGIAQIFGRKPAVLGAISIFGIGSIICGAAKNMPMLIGGRTFQGIGGGGILSLSAIVLADMVSLEERGLYAGLFGLTWSIAAALGPLFGGALANVGQWRWIFYINIPLCTVSCLLTIFCMNLPTPPGSLKEKLVRVDWVGNGIIMGASCAIIIALTMGGVDHPWGAFQILVPLIIGIVGLIGFMAYEALYAKYPLVPFHILSNRTSASGYLQAFLLPVSTLAVIYYGPVYFQACRGSSAFTAGVQLLPLASVGVAAIIGGLTIKKTQRYRPAMWIAWCLTLIGGSLFILIKVDTPVGIIALFCIIYGLGAGVNYAATVYPVLAPLPVSANAQALSFHYFMRSFAGVWGVTLGGSILQNELGHRLPKEFIASFPDGVSIVYAAIPHISELPEPLRSEVRQAFADSLTKVWIAVAVVGAAGLIASLPMEGLKLHSTVDKSWAPNAVESQDLESTHTLVPPSPQSYSRVPCREHVKN
ncbi:hypothetical protein M422DRAFT_41728 [Sphaerobolus stellatus SS14]|nr:hypothetical protein M422DRAFT_41728 [Sphaerobolus stellatus SS14]